MQNAHELKIEGAQACIREHLSHVKGKGGADCYASRQEAIETAWAIVSGSEKLDSAQTTEAFRPWESERASP